MKADMIVAVVFLLGAAWTFCFTPLGCGGSKLTAQDETDIAAYTAQQEACVAALTPSKASIDACRAKVKLAWASKWNAEFEGGFSDAGGQ